MTDKFYVYRPLLDLFGLSEGTDKRKDGRAARGYNESLAYGAYTGGPVDLVKMTLAEIDKLQTAMLRHPANKLNSSALGRYQIIRTTRRAIQEQLPDRYPSARLFDEACQDEMACYLLGQRGVDKWLSGRMKRATFINNLAKEWASIPTTEGRGHYKGQNAGVTLDQVNRVLDEVERRHEQGQPVHEVVPVEVEEEAEAAERRNWWQWLSVIPLTSIAVFFRDYPEFAWAATGGVVAVAVIALIGGRKLVRRVKEIADEVRA